MEQRFETSIRFPALFEDLACVNQGLGKSLLIIRFQEIVNCVHFECTNGVHIVSRDKDIYGSGAVHWFHILDDSKTIQIRHLRIEKNDVGMKFIDLLYRAYSVRRLAYNFNAVVFGQIATDTAPGDRFVIDAFKYAVSTDASFSRAWIELGWVYSATGDKNSALDAFQKAVDADPKQILPYKILAFDYAFLGNRDSAIATWQRLQSIAPGDPDIAPNLAGLYMAEKHYSDAAPLYEAAAQANPSDAYAQMRLGMVRLRSHNTKQGMEAMHKALQIDSGAEMLNDVAYEMAEADTNLADALAYSQRSVKEAEDRSQKVDLENIQNADLRLTGAISEYWDTLGWIYFKMGDLTRAESYLTSAWQLSQEGVIGDHLGQVYEKERKLPAALHVYMLALGANPRLEETAERMRKLANVPIPQSQLSAGAELSQMRTVKVPTITKESASADFNLLLVAGGKAEKVNFFRGSDLLRDATDSLAKTRFEEPFPTNSTARLLRRGILSCSSYTGCSFVFYPLSVAASAN